MDIHYLEGETTAKGILEVTAIDIKNMKSKALLVAIFYRFKNRIELVQMDEKNRGLVLFGIKCLIDCFEQIQLK